MDRIWLPPFRKEWHTCSSIVDRHSCHLLEKGGTRFPQSRPLSTTRLPLHFSPLSSRSLARSRVCVCLLCTHPLLLCIMASVQGVLLNVAAISSSSACIAPVAQQSVSRRCLCLDLFFFFGFSGFFFLLLLHFGHGWGKFFLFCFLSTWVPCLFSSSLEL